MEGRGIDWNGLDNLGNLGNAPTLTLLWSSNQIEESMMKTPERISFNPLKEWFEEYSNIIAIIGIMVLFLIGMEFVSAWSRNRTMIVVGEVSLVEFKFTSARERQTEVTMKTFDGHWSKTYRGHDHYFKIGYVYEIASKGNWLSLQYPDILSVYEVGFPCRD